MKKIALLTGAMAGLFVLSGCQLFERIFDPEKEYSYNDYKALLAERDFKKPGYTKCVSYGESKSESEEKSETVEFTWDSTLNKWTNEKGTMFELTFMSNGTVREDVLNLTDETAKDCTFYAKKKSYRITNKSESDEGNVEWEWQYDEYGYIIQTYLKLVNLTELTTTEITVKATYSK